MNNKLHQDCKLFSSKFKELQSKLNELEKNEIHNIKNGFLQWLHVQHDKIEKKFLEFLVNDQYYKDNKKNNFLHFNFFIENIWPFRFEKRFINSLQGLSLHNLEIAYSLMSQLLRGYFNEPYFAEIIDIYDGNLRFYYKISFENYTLLFTICIEKLPKLAGSQFTDISSIKSLDYLMVIRFLNIFNYSYNEKLKKEIEKFRKESGFIEERVIRPYDKEFLSNNHIFTTRYAFFETYDQTYKKPINFDSNQSFINRKEKVTPNKFFSDTFPIDYINKKSGKYKEENETSKKYYSFMIKSFKDYFEANSKFSKAIRLVEILEKIPDFGFKLTNQQKKVIGQEGNILLLGRSGTGKTTCSILRLFAMEFFFMLKMMKCRNEFESSHGKFKDLELQRWNQMTKLKCVFITASPILSEEVKNFYFKLKNHVRIQLKKKDEVVKNNDINTEKNKNQDINSEFLEEDLWVNNIILNQDQDNNDSLPINCVQNKTEFPWFLSLKDFLIKIDLLTSNAYQSFFFTQRRHIASLNKESLQKNKDFVSNYKKSKKMRDEIEIEEEIINKQAEYLVDEEIEETNDIKSLYQKEFELFQEKKLEETNIKVNALEIDYNVFVSKFWNEKLRKVEQCNLSSSMVWTEIFSIIKGSLSSHHFVYWHSHSLSESEYVYKKRDDEIKEKDKRKVWEIYKKYDIWKISVNGYDLMDLVNYLLHRFKYQYNFGGLQINYIMVDEVQDMPQATLLLLKKLAENGVFLSGDTAQKIEKGVNFKFSDLKAVFHEKDKQIMPIIKQLSINFRSHKKILNLGNSVISLIKIMFPKYIDKLKREKSKNDGAKPLLLQANESNFDLLFDLLNGRDSFKQKEDQNILIKPNIEFGSNQVLLVRNEENKKSIPKLFSNCLCLTIQQAKGLGFDDVILYNFFTDSLVDNNQWKIMTFVELESNTIMNNEYKNIKKKCNEEIQYLEHLEINDEQNQILESKINEDLKLKSLFNNNNYFEISRDEKNIELIEIIPNKKLKSINAINYLSLCNELKELYIAITRPKKRLIIFDDDKEKGKLLHNIWINLNLIEIVNEHNIKSYLNDNSAKNNSFLNVTSKSEWKAQGLKFMKNKFFENAKKCFEKSEDFELFKKAEILKEYVDCLDYMETLQKEKYEIHKNIRKKHSRIAKQNALKELKIKENNHYDKFGKLAEKLLENDLKLEAVEALIRIKDYNKAAEIYEKLQMWTNCGEMYFLLEDYDKAIESFIKIEDFSRVFECCEYKKDWDLLMRMIERFKPLIIKSEMIQYLKKYLPLAFDGLMNKVDIEMTVQTEFKDKKKKFEIIREENEDEFGSESESEESKQEEELSNNEQNEEENKIEEENKENLEMNENNEIEINLSNKQNSKNNEDIDEISLDIIEKSKDYSLINEISLDAKDNEPVDVSILSNQNKVIENKEFDDNDYLSIIDFDDEWIKSSKNSIIKSIKSFRQNKSAVLSEYSVFDNDELNPNMNLIKTNGDIMIADETMKKIIFYIKIFSDEFSEYISKLKSKSVLLSNQKDPSEEIISNFEMDMDNIDLDFVYIILDILEVFGLYKLCLFVCNRYKLANKIGRYLVSIACKFSFLATEKPEKISYQMFHDYFINMKKEKSFIANNALHSIFENINPEFLKQNKQGESIKNFNFLGLETYKKLVLLGFWKKCIFISDYETSLSIAKTFFDFKNFKIIFFKNHPILCNQKEKINLLNSEIPEKYLSFEILENLEIINTFFVDLYKICICQVLWEIDNDKKLFTNSLETKFSNEIIVKKKQNNVKFDCLIKEKNYEYSKILIEYFMDEENFDLKEILFEKYEFFYSNLKNLIDLKDNYNEIIDLKIFDIIVFGIQSIYNFNKNKMLDNLDDKYFYPICEFLLFIIESLKNNEIKSIYSKIILTSLLSSFRISLMEDDFFSSIFGSSNVLIHRTSIIFEDLLKKHEIKKLKLYSIDLEGIYYIVSSTDVFRIIEKSIFKILRNLIHFKYNEFFNMVGNNNYLYNIEFNEKKSICINLIKMITLLEKIDRIDNKNKDENKILKPKNKKKVEKLTKKQNIINTEYIETAYFNELIEKIDNSNENDVQIKTDKNQSQNLLKLFKRLIQYNNILIENNSSIKKNLIDIALNNLRFIKYKDEKIIARKLIKSFQILKIVNMENLIYEKYRLLSNNNLKNIFNSLWDSNIFLKNGCMDDYFESIFDYLSKSFYLFPFNDKIIILEEIFINLLVSQNENHKLLIPKSLNNILEEKNLEKNNKILIFNRKINLIDKTRFDEILYEIIHWLKKIYEISEENKYLLKERITNILFTIIININSPSNDILISIESLFKLIINDSYYNSFKDSVYELLSVNFPPFALKDFDKLKKNLLKINGSEIIYTINLFGIPDYLKEIHLKNEGLEFYDINYENSNKDYNTQLYNISKRIISQRIIIKYLRNMNILQKKQKKQKIENMNISFYLIQMQNKLNFNKNKIINFNLLTYKKHFLFDIFLKVEEFIIKLNCHFYDKIYSDPLDFHFINLQNENINRIKLTLMEYLEKYYNQIYEKCEIIGNDNIFIKLKNEIFELNENLNNWSKDDYKEIISYSIFDRNRRSLIKKMAQRNLFSRIKKIERKIITVNYEN